jgi:hypothetical protein
VLDGFTATSGTVSVPFPATFEGDNWIALENAVRPTFVNRSYYDISGYGLEDLTAFIQGVNIQEAWGPRGTAGCFVVDLITTEFVHDGDVIAAYIYPETLVPFPTRDLPGFPLSTFDMNQVIYGRSREFTPAEGTDTNANQYSQTQWGTCAATAGAKMHITRIVYIEPGPAADATVQVPPCDYASAIIVAKEKDLPYLMRLKRSFELATGP